MVGPVRHYVSGGITKSREQSYNTDALIKLSENYSAVASPVGLAIVGLLWPGKTEANRFESDRRDAAIFDQITTHRFCPALRQTHVVAMATDCAGMAFHLQFQVGLVNDVMAERAQYSLR